LFALSQEPLLQKRLAKERATNDSRLLHGLIKESLRLYPVAPFIGRYLPQDAQLGGHFIEKDVSKISNPNSKLNLIPFLYSDHGAALPVHGRSRSITLRAAGTDSAGALVHWEVGAGAPLIVSKNA